MNFLKLNKKLKRQNTNILKFKTAFKNSIEIYLKNSLIGIISDERVNILDNISSINMNNKQILCKIFNFSEEESIDLVENDKDLIYKELKIKKVFKEDNNNLFEVYLKICNCYYLYLSVYLQKNEFNDKKYFRINFIGYEHSYEKLEDLITYINSKGIKITEADKEKILAISMMLFFE